MARYKGIKLEFVIIEGKAYPRDEKSSNCPKPSVLSQTFEISRTPKQVISHLSGIEDQFMLSSPCWTDCNLECPAKAIIEGAILPFSKRIAK